MVGEALRFRKLIQPLSGLWSQAGYIRLMPSITGVSRYWP